MTLTIPRKRFCLILLAIALMLGILSLATAAYEWSLGVDNTYLAYEAARIFGVIYEGNIPSWYSALLLFMGAGFAALIAKLESKFFWGLLALILGYMSMDEAAELHELFTVPLRENLQLTGNLYFGWILVGIPLALMVGLLFIPFWLKLPRHSQLSFLFAALVYLTGAILVESYSASLWESTGYPTLPYHAISLIEELMEMGGVILVIHGLLWYLENKIGEIRLSIVSQSGDKNKLED